MGGGEHSDYPYFVALLDSAQLASTDLTNVLICLSSRKEDDTAAR